MTAQTEAGAGVVEIPMLPPGCGSWICTAPDGRVFELFDKCNVRKAADTGWKIETAVAYLARIIAEIKAGAQP